MTNETMVQTVADCLEPFIPEAFRAGEKIGDKVLNAWRFCLLALKFANSDFYWSKTLELENMRADYETRLPDISGEEFEDYVMVLSKLSSMEEE